MSPIQDSYELCTEICRASHSNFTAAFRQLSSKERRAMEVVYAFMRTADDLVDASGPVEGRAKQISEFRSNFESFLLHSSCTDSAGIFPAVTEVIQQYSIPETYFYEVLDGMQMDLERQFYRTPAELECYCYHVASAVGLICLHLWGVTPQEIKPCGDSSVFRAAVACGKALQWTNILRDVREDARIGRIYLPLNDWCSSLRLELPESEELCKSAFKQIQNTILNGDFTQFSPVIAQNLERARQFYSEAAGLANSIPMKNRRIFRLIVGVYREIFRKIERNPLQIFQQKIRLNKIEKLKVYFLTYFSSEF